jgi:hypothetical protein
VPLAAHSVDILSDDRLLALETLGSSSLGALCLAVETPSIAILLDMAHSLLERIATLSTEEVTEVPMLAKCNGVLANDGCLAMLASGREVFMPIKMTEVAKSLVTVFGQGLTFNLRELLPTRSLLDSGDALGTMEVRLRADFESLKSGTTRETYETMRMETFGGSAKSHYASFDR